MNTFRLLPGLTIVMALNSCGDKTPQPQKISYQAFHVTDSKDTINRINENGKQGLWVYEKADGSSTDTVYKDGIPQK